LNDFIIPEVVEASSDFNGRYFPLERAKTLQANFAMMFSIHLGCLKSDECFESEVLVLTGPSGAGKSREMNQLLTKFRASGSLLPSGEPAKMVKCVLDRKDGWKSLGIKTLKSMGFEIPDNTRITLIAIWELVATQARLQGVVVIHYDETQHILAGKTDTAIEEILDCFKSLLKSTSWPLMLILSGVPELNHYVPAFEQLARKVTQVTFEDIDYDNEAQQVSEIVQNYALRAGLEVDEDLLSIDFIHRLTTAGAFRWGLVFSITKKAVMEALKDHSPTLKRDHYIAMWVNKTKMNHAATPFTHEAYATVFRRDAPYKASILT
jgi:hypothetical protein